MRLLIIVFFMLSFFLIIFGISVRPKLKNINILPQTGDLNKICNREKIQCNTDSDCMKSCSEAQEGEEIICQALPNTRGLTATQQKILGSNGTILPPKYCVPHQKAELNCNISTGGIPVFTGWGGLDTMEFDCLCAYPLWASSRVCDITTGNCTGNCLLNPGICQPGVFNWDLTVDPKEPVASMCECADGYLLVEDSFGLPRCVPNGKDSFYTDIDIVTGIQGGQPKIPVDNVSISESIKSNCPSGTGYTTCGTGTCCTLKNSVCCQGSSLCCPLDYPICDISNMRCLKSSIECTNQSETKCSGGCCNTVNGTCCDDGYTCCPSSFPNCDPDRPYCNPNPTPLINSIVPGLKSCVYGSCPIPNGICCGNSINGKQYCCPPDYPICDSTLNMCRKPK